MSKLCLLLISALCLFGVASAQNGVYSTIYMGESVVDYQILGEDVYALNSDGSMTVYDHYTSTLLSISGNAYKIGVTQTKFYAVPSNNHSIINEYDPFYKTWTTVYANNSLTILSLVSGGQYLVFQETPPVPTGVNRLWRYNNYNWTLCPSAGGSPIYGAVCGEQGLCLVYTRQDYIYWNNVFQYPNWRWEILNPANFNADMLLAKDVNNMYARNRDTGEMNKWSGAWTEWVYLQVVMPTPHTHLLKLEYLQALHPTFTSGDHLAGFL